MFGYQFLAGTDYVLSDAVSLDFSMHWTDFDSFADGEVWEAVRSHPPHLRRDGSEPIATGRPYTSYILAERQPLLRLTNGRSALSGVVTPTVLLCSARPTVKEARCPPVKCLGSKPSFTS